MSIESMYYVWATVLLVVVAISWGATLLTLPGNWAIVAATALFAWCLPVTDTQGIGWSIVGVLVGMAILGELIEFAAGALLVAKQGGSRRAAALSIAGALFGSLMGATAGIPIPLLGPIIGAVLGGALGAFVGAYLGEQWKGRTQEESFNVGSGAFVGRILGTASKAAVGAIMALIVAIDLFF